MFKKTLLGMLVGGLMLTTQGAMAMQNHDTPNVTPAIPMSSESIQEASRLGQGEYQYDSKPAAVVNTPLSSEELTARSLLGWGEGDANNQRSFVGTPSIPPSSEELTRRSRIF